MISRFNNHNKLVFILCSLFLVSQTFASEITIGEGNTIDFGSADLISDDILIKNKGILNWGNGNHLITDFINETTGVSSAQISSISVSKNWHNSGVFNPGTSVVNFLDVNPVSEISGFTTFYDIIAITASNKTLQFKEATRQDILNNLVLEGSAGNLLRITSSSDTQEAYLGLNENASQSIDYVYVTNNHSVMQMISPGESNMTNSVQGPNVRGWFLTAFAFLVPSLNYLSILILILMTVLVSKNKLNNQLLGRDYND